MRSSIAIAVAIVGCLGCGEAPPRAEDPSGPEREDGEAREDGETRVVASSPEPAAPDWEAWARTADAWTDDGRPSERGGRGAVAILRPIDLRPSAACGPLSAPPQGTPTLHVRAATVGPDPDYSWVMLRRVLEARAPELHACADDCVEGTDLFEAWVAEDGTFSSLEARARTHDSDARTECLMGSLRALTLPEPRVAPSHLSFSIRSRPR